MVMAEKEESYIALEEYKARKFQTKDDEVMTEQEEKRLAKALEEFKQGKFISLEDLKKKLGD